MDKRTDFLPFTLLLIIALGLIPSAMIYRYVLPLLTSADGSYELLWSTVWKGTFWHHAPVLERINDYWPWLIQNHYGAYFTVCVLAASLTAGAWVALTRRHPSSLLHAGLGWLAGGVAGWVLTQSVELPTMAELLAMPGLAIIGSYIMVLFTAPALADREVAIVRGTRIVPHVADTAKVVAQAVRKGRVCLAGCMLPAAAEVRSMLLLGASGTGKTVAIQALMHTVRSRGDRMIVADPDGASMTLFWQPGDIILNPLDRRSVRWDLLGEIKRPSDYKHLAQSILPYTGDAKADEWMRHAQVIFAACMQTWHEGQLGTSDEFLQTLAIGGENKLRLLCQGTAAAAYFAEGGERMLTSIMGTLTPALEELEKLAGGKGRLFSVRDWVRQGTGTVWVPYGADEIAALRGPISCWMRLGIFELLAMPTSDSRRLWFFLDELDALGRIQGLKDCMVRARKKGGCIVAGIQSIAQVRAVNGDAEAQTIVEQFGTQLVLRCGASEGGGTADFASDLLGEREIERIETSTSHNRGQDGASTTTSYHRQLERAVLPSQVTQLPDLSGYLRISGRTEWLKLSYRPIELEERISPIDPAEDLDKGPQGQAQAAE